MNASFDRDGWSSACSLSIPIPHGIMERKSSSCALRSCSKIRVESIEAPGLRIVEIIDVVS